jgi:hypothetical protein
MATPTPPIIPDLGPVGPDQVVQNQTGATGQVGGSFIDSNAQFFKYPANLGQPPFDKWIYFEAKSGRHVVRDQVVSEAGGVDRTLSAVGLYLDATALKTSLQVHYETSDLGPFAGALVELAAQAGTNLMGLTGPQTEQNLRQSLKGIEKNLENTVKGLKLSDIVGAAKQAIGATAAEAAAKLSGSSDFAAGVALGAKPNPRTDILFDAAQYRTYDLSFMLIPRSLQEAQTIDRIIHFFQFYMLPIYGRSAIPGKVGAFMMGFPYEFEISLRDGSYNRLEHVNKFERCVLKDIVVDHAAGGKTAFVKAASGLFGLGVAEFYPVATSISLTFQEVRLLDRNSDAITRKTASALPDPRT